LTATGTSGRISGAVVGKTWLLGRTSRRPSLTGRLVTASGRRQLM